MNMNRFQIADCGLRIVLAWICWTGLAARAAAKDVHIEFDIQPRVLTLEERALVTLTVKGANNPPAPKFPPLDGFEIRFGGTQHSVSINNGRKEISFTHRYVLSPKKAGTFKIGPFAYQAGGKKIDLPAIELKVMGQQKVGKDDESKRLFARITASKKAVYNQEVFDLVIAVYSRDINLGHNFGLEDMPEKGIITEKFHETHGSREEVDGLIYEVKRFRTKARALTAGKFTLSPTLRVNVRIPRQRRRHRIADPFADPFSDEFFSSFFDNAEVRQASLKTPPLELEVLPLPTEGRPPSFNGAVGHFDFEVDLKKSEPLSVGDPIAITMTVSGNGNIDALTAPDLPEMPAFKTYPIKKINEQIDDVTATGRRVFETVIRPKTPDVEEAPAIIFAYFDPEKKKYATIAQGPYPITVQAASNSVVFPSPGPHNPSHEINEVDIVYLKPMPELWRKGGLLTGFAGTPFIALQTLPALAMLAVFLTMRRREALAGDVARTRRIKAPRIARASLQKAAEALRANKRTAFFDALWETLTAYFGNRLNLAPGEIQGSVVLERFRQAGLDAQVGARIEHLFTLCDQHRYSGHATQDWFEDKERTERENDLRRIGAVLKQCESIKL